MKQDSPTKAATTKEYVAVRSLSIEDASFLPGDQITESSLELLPPGRLDKLLRGGWVRAQH